MYMVSKIKDEEEKVRYIINDFCLLFYLLLTFVENISRGSGEVYCCTENAIIYEELMPLRICIL
jgi:hypothetical protein